MDKLKAIEFVNQKDVSTVKPVITQEPIKQGEERLRPSIDQLH